MSAVTALRPAHAVLPLAAQESRRLVLHPLTLVGFAMFAGQVAWNLNGAYGPRLAFEQVDSMLSYFPGILLILVGNLVASRDHRAGSGELLAAVPTGRHRRTLALVLASLAPMLLGLVAVLVVHGLNLALDEYLMAPDVWQVLQAPLTLAGAVLLGVLVARWLPGRASVLVVMVAMVAANAVLSERNHGALFGPMFGWTQWGVDRTSWAGVFAGSPGWRVGYLAGLSALAAVGSLVATSGRGAARRRLVGLGLAVLAVTALCGWLMLP